MTTRREVFETVDSRRDYIQKIKDEIAKLNDDMKLNNEANVQLTARLKVRILRIQSVVKLTLSRRL